MWLTLWLLTGCLWTEDEATEPEGEPPAEPAVEPTGDTDLE